MKPTTTSTLSGCVVWIIVFGILGSCIFPITMLVGGITSASNFAMQTIGPVICPDGTRVQTYSYTTTTTDEHGNTQPSTAYELHCVDANGIVLKKDPVLYAFAWIGIIAVIGLGIAALLAFALAAPAGLFISKLLSSGQKSKRIEVIGPT